MVIEQLQILCLVSDEWGPIGPYETDLLDYVAGSTKFSKFHFPFHYFYWFSSPERHIKVLLYENWKQIKIINLRQNEVPLPEQVTSCRWVTDEQISEDL